MPLVQNLNYSLIHALNRGFGSRLHFRRLVSPGLKGLMKPEMSAGYFYFGERDKYYRKRFLAELKKQMIKKK